MQPKQKMHSNSTIPALKEPLDQDHLDQRDHILWVCHSSQSEVCSETQLMKPQDLRSRLQIRAVGEPGTKSNNLSSHNLLELKLHASRN